MSRREIETILKQVEQLLATAGTLPAEVEEAVEKLLNVVESLCSHNQTLLDEVKRLRQEQNWDGSAMATGKCEPRSNRRRQLSFIATKSRFRWS
ncbi:MAG: hypothetical protein GY924_05375, partial [Planctomycetaceae bacterium]|nr:hypothetical protein [Planctomycetaceae bacterium]